MKELSELLRHSRELRELLMQDTARPSYHLLCFEDNGVPGDPNAAFYANGRVHLMFLYHCASDGFRYGHLSSADLLHWRRHPDALIPDNLDAGIFSGGAFADEDGTVYIAYWALKSENLEAACNGIRIAFSRDAENDYTHWEKFSQEAVAANENGVLNLTLADGTEKHLAAADPSNIWKKDGMYYFQAGNLTVLNRYGRENGTPEYRGDYTELYRSADLRHWEPVHRFYERRADNRWTDESEDDMCPSFLPLPGRKDGGTATDTWLQLFISHNKGCQYYLGSYDRRTDVFLPRSHGRMSWVDNSFFAPEALILPDGRQVMWAWIQERRENEDGRFGWSGVYSLPRTLWLAEDHTLGIAPIEELKQLRGRSWKTPSEIRSNRCEMVAEFEAGTAAQVDVLVSEDGTEFVRIAFDAQKQVLTLDTSACGKEGTHRTESAPLVLRAGETLCLDIFVDASVVEVFANDRQAICRRAFPSAKNHNRVRVSGVLTAFSAWEMDYTNPY